METDKNPVRSAAIEVRCLRKSFGRTPVLDGVDLEVRRGETLVILGASGSGKSTLLRVLVGLERPDSGTVRIHETDVFHDDRSRITELRQKIGVAFQAGALFGSMTIAENIELPLMEHTRLPSSTRRIIAQIKLGMVGLDSAMDLTPAELSGGMRKRAALARALALDPEILFFDEPSAGLDPVTGAGLDRLIMRIKDAFQPTVVVVTHEMVSAFTIADRMALMHDGRFLVIGTPDEVQASSDPVVRQFLDRRPADEREGTKRLEELIEGTEG